MNLRPQRPERCALADCATPRFNDPCKYTMRWPYPVNRDMCVIRVSIACKRLYAHHYTSPCFTLSIA